MAFRDKLQTEHNGPKNGGGFWGKRTEAKETSDHYRRVNDKLAAEHGYVEFLEKQHDEGYDGRLLDDSGYC